MNQKSIFDEAEIISEYTDNEAIEDGCILPLLGNHRITRNAYEELKSHYQDKGYSDYKNNEFILFFGNEVLVLSGFAIRNFNNGGILKTDYNFKVGNYKHSKVLWLIPNELGGVTLMKPEDY